MSLPQSSFHPIQASNINPGRGFNSHALPRTITPAAQPTE
jgi:hypothetical protein